MNSWLANSSGTPMPLSYRELSQPDTEPVTLAQAKQHLRVDFDDDDDYILALITAARQYVEKYINRSIYPRKMRLTMDSFPWQCGDSTIGSTSGDSYLDWYWRGLVIRLPKPSTVSVESISYVDDGGTARTVDPHSYVVDLNSEPARIAPSPGFNWPYPNNYRPGSVSVDYTSGTYEEGSCPFTIYAAMLLIIGHLYSNREASTTDNLKTLPLGVNELLAGEVHESIY